MTEASFNLQGQKILIVDDLVEARVYVLLRHALQALAEQVVHEER